MNRVRLPESLPELSPNLSLQLAAIHVCSIHHIGDPHCWERLMYKQLLDRWTDTLSRVILYDYDPVIFPQVFCCNLKSNRIYDMSEINEMRVPFYKV